MLWIASDRSNPGDVRIVLFVRLRDNLILDNALIASIKAMIRNHTTVHHVPTKILQVSDIPHTKSGKLVELAVRNVVHGLPVRNTEALANPEALDDFRDRVELQTVGRVTLHPFLGINVRLTTLFSQRA